MSGFVEAAFTQAGRPEITVKIPVFTGGPDARRNMAIQIFVMRVSAGGAGVIATDAASVIFTRDLRIIGDIYERLNVAFTTAVGPGVPLTDIVTVGTHSLVLIDPPAGVNPLSVTFADENTIGTKFPAVDANTLRLVYTGRLNSGNRGEAFPDVDFAGRGEVGTAFISAALSSTGPYSPAHELGHILTNKSVSKNNGHYLAPTDATGVRLTNDQNLMRNATSSTEGVLESKRLWDEPDGDGLNQFTNIRSSHFTSL
jgi:hypothetical protein